MTAATLPKPLVSVIAAAQTTGRAFFLKHQPEHLLVLQMPEGAERDQVSTAMDVMTSAGAELAVAPISKRPGANGFPGMVTIGRTPNNDVWLPSPGVSKFHAYVTLQSGMPCLVDANSVTGTFYGDQRLLPNMRVPLHSGARVQFGGIVGTFLSAADFYDLRVG